MKRRSAIAVMAICLFATIFVGHAQQTLAPTPPLGWNSWDAYAMGITESEFRDSVLWFHQHLQPTGWQYVVIDEGWFFDHPYAQGDRTAVISPDGRYLPSTLRFPSAADGAGLKPIAGWTHSLGLKFGIHIVRGIPRSAVQQNLPIADSPYHAADAADTTDLCRWDTTNYGIRDNAAGQAYYNSIAKLYAGWGVDFLKVDCISQPYDAHEIHMIDRALKLVGQPPAGHPIVLSLSPGPTPLEDAADVVEHAQLWRISDDFWDLWSKPGDETFPQTIVRQFGLLSDWAPYAGPGHWPDADMLPIGYLGPHPGWGDPRQSRLTPEERRTLITLWSIARSPLILGANLLQLTPADEALLTNPDVLAVDQHSTASRSLVHTPEVVIWTSRAATPGDARASAAISQDSAPDSAGSAAAPEDAKPGSTTFSSASPESSASGNAASASTTSNSAAPRSSASENSDRAALSVFDSGVFNLAIFNLKDQPATISYAWSTLGFPRPHYHVRDLWKRKNLGSQSGLTVTLPAHGAALFTLR